MPARKSSSGIYVGNPKLGEIFERVKPEIPLEWTGERLTTATAGQVEIEHLHRYFLSRELCRGLDVLDVAAGEGYGTALLAQVARSVVGVEISADAVAHAARAYRGSNFCFVNGDARRLPMDDGSVDAVVSFETIEHFYEHDQFLAEVRRVLRPGGRFIVSSPERDVYSPSGSCANPYHVRELSGAEFSLLLRNSFANVRLLAQRPLLGSALVSDGCGSGRTLTFEKRGPGHFEASIGLPRPLYFVAIASDQPVADVPDSLYIETAEIQAVLAGAASAELPALRAQLSAAESARASALSELALSIRQADEQAESYRRQLIVADQASHDHAARASMLEASLAESRGEAVAACAQRDIARMAARRAAAASEGHWRGRMSELEQRASIAEQRADSAEQRAVGAEQRASIAEQRADSAEQQAAEWRLRYEGMRARLEAFLRRFWILPASRLIPASVRRFLRQRLLGWGRQ